MHGLGSVVRSQEALSRHFPHVDAEALAVFSESCGGWPDEEALMALAEMELEASENERPGEANFLPNRSCEVMRRGEPLSSDAVAGEWTLQFEGGSDAPRVGTVLLLKLRTCCGTSRGAQDSDAEQRAVDDQLQAAVAIPTGEVLALEPVAGRFLVKEYGMHELRLKTNGSLHRCLFMVTSQLGDFAEALDHFHDACDWVWGGNWTEELDSATVCLLSALDDYFNEIDATLDRSPMLRETLQSELRRSHRRLETSLAKALEFYDIQAVGRVYGAVRSLLQSQSLLDMMMQMLGGGGGRGQMQDSHLYQSVLAFEKARFEAASDVKRDEVKAVLARLIMAADAHAAELSGGPENSFTTRWHGELRDVLVHMRDDQEAIIHPLPFQQLRGGNGSYITDMMKSMMEVPGGAMRRAETIEAHSSLSPGLRFREAEDKVSRWSESLVDESVIFGTPLQPFEVHSRDPWARSVLAAIQSVLTLGFGYVTEGADGAETSKVAVLLDRVRAALPLHAQQKFLRDRRRRDRLKDVCRVVRAARKKGQRLSLTVNTDFPGTLRALKEHHTDNWVGPSLEGIWMKMLPEKRVFCFELWLHDVSAGAEVRPRLVAADFGHPHTHGLAYYVATRFFDREFRNLQPGFILAFAEAECLKRAGFEVWDLGGADASPMMQYKPQVAISVDRSEHLRYLRELRRGHEAAESDAPRMELALTDWEASPPSLGEKVPTGVVFDDVSEEHLWGFVALRELEERIKKEEEELKRALKKKQRPPKAVRRPPAAGDTTGSALPQKVSAQSLGTANSARHPVGQAPDATQTPEATETPLNNRRSATGEEPCEARRDAGPGSAAARLEFMTVFNRLLAAGLSKTEAAAQALQAVSVAG